ETAKNYAELVALARRNPDKLAYGSLGRTAMMLYIDRFNQLTGVKIREIPYKGVNEIATALMRNEIQLASLPGPFVRGAIDAGRIRPILVASSSRLSDFPDVPTASEVGLADYLPFTWNCIMSPSKVPVEIRRKIHATMRDVVSSVEFREALYR